MLPEFFDGWPFWLVFGFLFFGAMTRGQAIYWMARVVTEQSLRRARPRSGWRKRAADWLEGEGVGTGIETVRRWGLPAITACYLTVGLQTLILAGAGVLRIGAWGFFLAQIPGSIAWAIIYSTIGWAVWEAAVVTAAGSPWGLLGLGAAAVIVVLVVIRRRAARAAARPAQPPPPA